MSPSSIDLRALQERLAPAITDPGAASGVAAADVHEGQGYIWWPNTLTRHQLTELDLKETRKRSQWLCINTAARVLRRLSRYVGVSAIMPNTTDAEFNAELKKWWSDDFQSKAGNYEMSGKYSSEGFINNCRYQAWRDSDCLALHLTAPDGSPTSAAIEAARIDTDYRHQFDSKWQDGVLTDFFYKHEMYSIAVDPPGRTNWAPTKFVQVAAGHAHMFADFETQASTRGTPALTHAVQDLLDEREIHNSVLSSIKAHGQVGYYLKKAIGASAGPSVNFTVPGAKRKDTVEPSGGSTPSSKTTSNKRTVAEVMSRGDIVETPPGYELDTVTDGREHANETEIKNGIFRKLALGMGLPTELFILLDQLTGPGVRLILRQTQDWREYWLKSTETWQSADYCRRVEYAVRTGRLRKCKDPNFLRHYFVRPRAITIDDGRTASAQVAALDAGITTLDEIYGEKGMDWKEEATQRAEEIAHGLKECARLGIPPEYYFKNVKPAEPDDEEAEEKKPVKKKPA